MAIGLDVVAQWWLDCQNQVIAVDCVLMLVQALGYRIADIVDGSFDVLGDRG